MIDDNYSTMTFLCLLLALSVCFLELNHRYNGEHSLWSYVALISQIATDSQNITFRVCVFLNLYYVRILLGRTISAMNLQCFS